MLCAGDMDVRSVLDFRTSQLSDKGAVLLPRAVLGVMVTVGRVPQPASRVHLSSGKGGRESVLGPRESGVARQVWRTLSDWLRVQLWGRELRLERGRRRSLSNFTFHAEKFVFPKGWPAIHEVYVKK